jgi:hypothetical protein
MFTMESTENDGGLAIVEKLIVGVPCESGGWLTKCPCKATYRGGLLQVSSVFSIPAADLPRALSGAKVRAEVNKP